MNAVAILGLQWGNEGKGRITDLFSKEADYIIRYQGGNTVSRVFDLDGDNEVSSKSLSIGIIKNKNSFQIFTAGAVLNLEYLIEDIEKAKVFNPNIENQILIDGKANIVMPYHIAMDKINEQIRGNSKLGTTLTGIGPTYMDKVTRFGIRFVDLFYKDIFYSKLKNQIENKKYLFERFQCPLQDIDEVFSLYLSYAEKLKHMLVDSFIIINKAVREDLKLLFEGYQSTMLDIDHGTYPYVTSSSPTVGGIISSAGIPPYLLKEIIGVFKAYSTRVGMGFFPTEIKKDSSNLLEIIASKGAEYNDLDGIGTTIKRCGWLDIPQLKYAIMINGITKLVLTKIDVFSGFEKIKIATAYMLNGKRYEIFSSIVNAQGIDDIEYIELDGWQEDILNCQYLEQLPKNCINFIKTIEKLLNFPISIVSNSSDKRSSNIVLN